MLIYACVFSKTGREERGAKQLATASHPSPTHAPWTLLRRISAETAGIITTWMQHLQHTATWREAGSQRGGKVGEERERAKISESDQIYVKSFYMKIHIWWCFTEKEKQRDTGIQWNQRENKGHDWEDREVNIKKKAMMFYKKLTILCSWQIRVTKISNQVEVGLKWLILFGTRKSSECRSCWGGRLPSSTPSPLSSVVTISPSLV